MFIRQFVFRCVRTLSVRHVLPATGLAAFLFFAGPAQLQAGKCPPCSGDANECAYACCLFQDCESSSIIGCTAWCSLGYTVAKIFEDGDSAPAFKSFSGQARADCGGDNRVGAIVLPPVGLRNMSKRVEIGLLSMDRRFLTSAGDVTGVVVEIARKQDYQASGGRPRWEPLGRALMGSEAGVWVLDWNLATYSAEEYVLRAVATRKDGRVQEARALAASQRY